MRVVAGTLRGRILRSPQGETTRPITDRVKVNLFNILAPRLADAVVADCFCGTGSLGIEALSRSAAQATFADIDGTALRLLRENLEEFGLTDRSRIVRQDVLRRGLPAPGIGEDGRGYADTPRRRDGISSPIPASRCPGVLASTSPPAPSPYSLVFLDPPYRLTETAADRLWLKLDEAAAAGQLVGDAIIVWRYQSGVELAMPAPLAERLRVRDRREYGSQTLMFIERIVGST